MIKSLVDESTKLAVRLQRPIIYSLLESGIIAMFLKSWLSDKVFSR